MTTARIAFTDGSVYHGRSVGAEGTSGGEAVFNTGMTGYQEVLTDPSYSGQIVTMTYPEIGNYGINSADMESARSHVAGFVVRHCCAVPSNFRSEESDDQRNVQLIDGTTGRVIAKASSLSNVPPLRCVHIAAENMIQVFSRDAVISIRTKAQVQDAP